MKHEKNFRRLETSFSDPDQIDDATEVYLNAIVDDPEDFLCMSSADCELCGTTSECGVARCLYCGGKV